MPHGSRDQQSDAPTWVVDAASGKSGQETFGNTTFGVSTVEATVTKGMASPGWNRIVRGQGQVASFVVNSIGAGYANGDIASVTANTGANATGTIATHANGSISGVTLVNPGGLFNSNAGYATFTTAGGTGANVGVIVGGRANRIQFETLVATRSIVTDATSFSNTSSSAVANSTGNADDFILPEA